jgi:hypothetical protein
VKRTVAVRTSGPIQVDGTLDERDWQSSSTIGEILQREPREGVPATEKTEVRVLFDEANLYIGVICYDSDSKGIIATQMSCDADLSVNDRIEILLDTFLDRRNAFYFSTNPAGALVVAGFLHPPCATIPHNAIPVRTFFSISRRA